MIKVFGTAFDPLDMSHRVDIKVAYLNSLEASKETQDNFLDPYDFLENSFKRNHRFGAVKWIGKFPVESWLRPKPQMSDAQKMFPRRFTEFLDSNGCYDYYNRLVDYLRESVGPSIPVMIGVDHCLTGGVLKFLRERYDDFNILIFDSHCDIIDLETRRSYFAPYTRRLKNPDLLIGQEIYECGSFLSYLLKEKIINPEKLWIIGAQDLDHFEKNSESPYIKPIFPLIERGIHIISKDNLILSGIPNEIKGQTYISFDIDLGSLASVFAARFLNYVGLNIGQFLNLINELSEKISKREIELIGLDITEIDIHFLGANICDAKDYTGEIMIEIIDRLIYSNFVD